MSSSASSTYTVVGYRGCGFAEHACSTMKRVADENEGVSCACTMTSRAEYRDWLAAGQGLAKNVPRSHRTSPACFKNDEFIGGCDELLDHVETTFGDKAMSGSSGCAVQ